MGAFVATIRGSGRGFAAQWRIAETARMLSAVRGGRLV